MIEDLTRAEYEALLRQDFAIFAARCFHELNPQAELAMNWHLEVIAAKATATAWTVLTSTPTALTQSSTTALRERESLYSVRSC